MVILASVQSQDSHARAVIDRRVLEPFAPPPYHHLHVDLDGIARAFLLKQLQLLRAAAPRLDQALDTGTLPIAPPLPNRHAVQPKVSTRGLMPYSLAYSTTARRCFTRNWYRVGIPGIPSIAPPVGSPIIEAPDWGSFLSSRRRANPNSVNVYDVVSFLAMKG